MSSTDRPTCTGCRHFVVTHDPRWPYACGVFGFRARQHPAVEVRRSSGHPCRAREERPRPVRRSARDRARG